MVIISRICKRFFFIVISIYDFFKIINLNLSIGGYESVSLSCFVIRFCFMALMLER